MSAWGRAVCFCWSRGNSFWLYQAQDCLFQAEFFPPRVHCLRKPSFPLFHGSGFPKNTVNQPLSLCCITINPQPEDKHQVKTPPDPEFSHCWDTPINVVIQWWLLRTPFPRPTPSLSSASYSNTKISSESSQLGQETFWNALCINFQGLGTLVDVIWVCMCSSFYAGILFFRHR